MLAKKFLAVAVSMAIAVPAFSFSSMAASGDVVKVGDKNVKIFTDLESRPEGRIGQKGDKVWTNTSNKNNDTQGLNFTVKSGAGVDESKGLFFGVNSTNAIPSGGWTEGAVYNPEEDSPSITDWTGATDFVFYIDATTYPESDLSFQVIFQEWDMNTDGTVDVDGNDNAITSAWGPLSAEYYTLENGSWVKHTATKGSYYITISNKFKGYVDIPISSFANYWGTTDTDGKFNLKHLMSCNWYHGFYPKDATNGGAFAIDNLGFVGDYQVATTTSTTESTTTTTGSDVTTTTTGTDTTGTDTTGTDTTGTKATGTTTKAVATTITKATAATTTATGNTTSPKTGEAPITAALLTAITFAGVLLVSKKRSK